MTNKNIIATAILVSACAGALFGFLASGLAQYVFPGVAAKFGFSHFLDAKMDSPEQTMQEQLVITEDEAVIRVVENATPSVVSVVVTKDVPLMRGFSPFDFFFGLPSEGAGDQELERRQVGGGTGFFVSADGLIVTNRHVVADVGAEYSVLLSDGTELPATVLARDSVLDFAVLDVDGENFPALRLGNSDELRIGQSVIAIGNSLGEFANTVSRGIVSGLQRDIEAASGPFERGEQLTNIIQTDAAINPGNSGGPLFNISGEVIGINTAVAQGAENIGFAIPISQVTQLVGQVKETGKIARPFIGVRYTLIDDVIAAEMVDFDFEYGALVSRGEAVTDFAVVPGSPADKAGLRENDVILEIDGQKITLENPLGAALTSKKVGDILTLKVWRSGNVEDIEITLGERE